MSQRSKVVHDFQAINLAQSQLQITNADSSITLGPSHSGDIIALNATGGSAVTLPTPSTGLFYRFVVTNTGGHVLTAPSACINGAISVSQFSTSANFATGPAKTFIKTTAGSLIGDQITLVGIDSKYFLSGSVGLFNALVFNS
jgi:hypothetical protein